MYDFINSYASTNKSCQVLVYPPFPRNHPIWIQSALEIVHDSFNSCLKNPVKYNDRPPLDFSDLSKDGIHIKSSSVSKMKQYLKSSLSKNVSCASQEDSIQVVAQVHASGSNSTSSQSSNKPDESRKQPRSEDQVDLESMSTNELILYLIKENKSFLAKSSMVDEKISVVEKKISGFGL